MPTLQKKKLVKENNMASTGELHEAFDTESYNETEDGLINNNLSYMRYLQVLKSQQIIASTAVGLDQLENTVVASSSQPKQTAIKLKDDYDEELIEMVRAYNIVWNTKGRGFKDTNRKNQAWKEIADKMRRNVDEIKTRWKNLRDGMQKCLKKIDETTRSGSGSSKTPTCKCFDQLLFLRDSISNKENTTSNIVSFRKEPVRTDPSLSNSSVNDEVDDDSNLSNATEKTSPSPHIVSKPSSRKRAALKQKSIDRRDSIDMLLINALKETKPPENITGDTEKAEKVENPDWHFLQSLLPILEKLPAKKNRKARLELQRVLLDIEFDASEEN